MLRKFRVKNFLSFRDWQTLDLTVAANAPDLPGRFVRSVPGSKDRFPTFVAIFGANASGKTNILRALTFVSGFVQHSQDARTTDHIALVPYFGKQSGKENSEFEVELDALFDASLPRRRFFYKLVISHDQERVLEEELSYYSTNRPRRLFLRRGQEFKFGKDFQIRRNDPAVGKIRKNSSVISTLAQFNHSLSSAIVMGLNTIQSNVAGILGNREINFENMLEHYQENPNVLNKFVEMSRKFDVGIEKIEIEFENGSPKPLFYHRGVDTPILHSMESHGTNKIFSLFPILNYVLETGSFAIVDELDNTIHSLLLPEIIDLFADPVRNPLGAQLIAVCHNASILQHLEKEEVYFTEKADDGATTIYGLKNIRGVRRESNIYANYLAGAFGGVPKVA